ncbi:MAG: NAD(P)H-dependent oxidoreductase [Prosthecobacter sp.]
MSPTARRYHVLVIDAHPRGDSYCHALAGAVVEGAEASLHEVRLLALRDLHFDPHYTEQELEPCLARCQESLCWAEHIVLVYPVWWGTMPALLKGWLDRVLLPGFAFADREDGGWDGLLNGRSATLVVTMDTPLWVFRWILRAPSLQALRAATLGFCGISPVRTLLFSPVKTSTPQQRERWLLQAKKAGLLLDTTLRSGWKARLRTWLQIMRPQFYFFPWLALTAGAVNASASSGASFRWTPYFLCWAAAWLLEFISVLTNEIHDLPTDQVNRNHGPFTGGSRALVQGVLTLDRVRKARRAACLGLLLVAGLLGILQPESMPAILIFLGLGLILGMGYTAPPLRLVTRTWGEVNVAFTHSVLVVLCGHFSQTSRMEAGPWLIAVPIFFAVLPSIILAGFPDLEADASVGKKTIAVRFGRVIALKVAVAAVVVAAIARVCAIASAGSFTWADVLMGAHAAVLLTALWASLQRPRAGRINGLLVLALSYMIWFALAAWLQT